MITRWLVIGLALALVAMTGATGVYAFQYARQASALDTALASNALLSKALDRVVAQAKIDEKAVADFNRQTADIRASLAEQEQALNELNNDPVAKPYLDTAVPDSVRKLFPNR